MKKFIYPFVLSAGLLLTVNVDAQKGKAAKAPAKQNVVQPPKEETPYNIEEPEDTKIDVVSTAAFDSTAAPDDELTREIKKLLAVCNAVEMGVSTTEKLLLQQKALNTDKEKELFYTRFLHTFKSQRVHGLLENIFVKAYRDAFTLAEIKQLADFYKTPIGKKSLEMLPAILQKSQADCSQLGAMLATEIMQEQAADEERD